MTNDQLEWIAAVMVMHRALGKAAMTSRAAMLAAKEAQAAAQAANRARKPKFAATLREHYSPAAESDRAGRLMAWVAVAAVAGAYLFAMTSDFAVMP